MLYSSPVSSALDSQLHQSAILTCFHLRFLVLPLGLVVASRTSAFCTDLERGAELFEDLGASIEASEVGCGDMLGALSMTTFPVSSFDGVVATDLAETVVFFFSGVPSRITVDSALRDPDSVLFVLMRFEAGASSSSLDESISIGGLFLVLIADSSAAIDAVFDAKSLCRPVIVVCSSVMARA